MADKLWTETLQS